MPKEASAPAGHGFYSSRYFRQLDNVSVVEFPQLQFIDLSELIYVLKTVAIVTSEHLNLSMIFVVSHLLIAKVSPKWRSNRSFGTQK